MLNDVGDCRLGCYHHVDVAATSPDGIYTKYEIVVHEILPAQTAWNMFAFDC